jgi:hypothetical protein
MPNPDAPRFVWVPGQCPDREALLRLERRFVRPEHAMSDASMGPEPKTFVELTTGEAADLPTGYLMDCLSTLANCVVCHGRCPEWDDWFYYLLPRLVPRAADPYPGECLVEPLITATVALHPRELQPPPGRKRKHDPYFGPDVLATLGQVLMAPALWEGEEMALDQAPAQCFVSSDQRGSIRASGGFSASMFFCWKYLEPEQIDAWLASVFAIRSAYWRAQLLVWLLGARPMIDGDVEQPAGLEQSWPRVDWSWSFCLTGRYALAGPPVPFIPPDNRTAFRESLRRHLSLSRLLEWMDTFAAFDSLREGLGYFPEQFAGTYLENRLPG